MALNGLSSQALGRMAVDGALSEAADIHPCRSTYLLRESLDLDKTQPLAPQTRESGRWCFADIQNSLFATQTSMYPSDFRFVHRGLYTLTPHMHLQLCSGGRQQLCRGVEGPHASPAHPLGAAPRLQQRLAIQGTGHVRPPVMMSCPPASACLHMHDASIV